MLAVLGPSATIYERMSALVGLCYDMLTHTHVKLLMRTGKTWQLQIFKNPKDDQFLNKFQGFLEFGNSKQKPQANMVYFFLKKNMGSNS